MSKIDFTKLNSANVTADNSVDTEKVYDINANVNISGNSVTSIDGGSVKKDDVQVATFSRWGENSLNINFMNVDAMAMCSIITEVNAFIEGVETKVQTETIEL
jgi:hypothetical protein